MSKVRVYELSKELNVKNDAIIKKAEEFGVKVTNLSGVEADLADKLRKAFSPEKPEAKENKPKEEKNNSPKEKQQ